MKDTNDNSIEFCAFLRGVNVKGTAMKMIDVCGVFQREKMENVSSVLASGNILFSSPQNREHLKTILEKALSKHFNYDAFVFLRDIEEVETIYNKNPFEAVPEFHIYSFVGISGIEEILMEEFEKVNKVKDEAALIVGGNFYWKVPKGNTIESEFGKILGRKNLKNAFTSRNINTFEKILKKSNN